MEKGAHYFQRSLSSLPLYSSYSWSLYYTRYLSFSAMLTTTTEQSLDFCRILVLTEETKDMGNVKNGSKSDSPTPDPFPLCVVSVDIESGGNDVSKISKDGCENIKTDVALTKPLRRQNSLQTGEAIQPLMNQILMLFKFDAKEKQGVERSYYDGANNRWRKCKRMNLFDSRRIVLLFSILSSIGTLVLIYLTLRVRQVSEVYIRG